MTFKEYLGSNYEKKFDYFMDTLFATNRTPQYWVDWNKVVKNSKRIEISLNTMNYLVQKDNIRVDAKDLFMEQPQLLECVPILLATRDERIGVFSYTNITDFNIYELDFQHPNLNEIDRYLDFMEATGLLHFLFPFHPHIQG